MNKRFRLSLSLILGPALTVSVVAADVRDPAKTLITNVHVFDGKNEKRIENANVLVEGNLIKQVSENAIAADGATVIDGEGRTLMPGMIEGHGHVIPPRWGSWKAGVS